MHLSEGSENSDLINKQGIYSSVEYSTTFTMKLPPFVSSNWNLFDVLKFNQEVVQTLYALQAYCPRIESTWPAPSEKIVKNKMQETAALERKVIAILHL